MTPTSSTFVPSDLVAEAIDCTGGLDDFGDPTFRDALEVLCRALRDEAKLSVFGTDLLRMKLVAQLVDRLRVEDWFRQHPEIESEVVAPPVVIVGLPRTGSTTLHRLLACDPRFWWMAWWESIYPIPFPDETLTEPDRRRAQARRDVAAMVSAMPELMAIHPMDADAADEEVMLMEHSFISAFNAYADIPTYTDWLNGQDQGPAYRYLRRMLQFLQWQQRQRGITAERWLLKSPHHLLRAEVLLEVFPGAQVIQTHRDPLHTIPSMASFVHVLRQIYADRSDPLVAGAEWSALMRAGLEHAMAVRESHPDQFLDVAFADVVDRPLDVVRRIDTFLGWDLPVTTEQAMTDWLQAAAQEPRRRHHYNATEFGLSEDQLRRDFARYRESHAVATREPIGVAGAG